MERRLFLRSLGAVGISGLLSACGGSTPSSVATPSADASSAAPQMSDLLARVAPNAEENLSVINASFELLTGPGQAFAFGVTERSNEPLKNADLDVYVVPASGGSPSGPYAAEFRDIDGIPLGLYLTSLDLDQPGPTSFVVVTADGSEAGQAAVQVSTPKASVLPTPGERAVAVPTATVANRRGVKELCTRKPPCGMHEVSLHEAMRQGRPAMLTFATPAYCQTAVCGPSVDNVELVRTSQEWGDIAWIHVEIYRDAGQTLATPVEAWKLPSEPWLFAIDRRGKVAARTDGPLLVLPDHVAELAGGLRNT